MSECFPALESLAEKFRAFGWVASYCSDGHDSRWVVHWLSRLSSFANRPRALVCRTVKGKGVSFIEQGQPLWHYRSPSEEEYEQALRELA
jgi:transketolase